jgi:F-type H+-transporting ATPase subunit a
MLMPFFGLETEPLSAQHLFSIGPLSVTNAMFFSVVTAAFTVIFLLLVARFSQLYPKSRLAYAVELVVDFVWDSAIGAFGDKRLALKHLPLLGSLFLFILVGNLTGSGMLPGVGTITAHSGTGTNILLRPFTTDLNATLSMAILTIGLVQFYSIRFLGFKKYGQHFFAPPFYNPMNIFIGINEVFGEILKIVTLSMRLFGVIYAGEVLITAVSQIAGNFGWLAAVPTVLLEIFFSVIQAYVFMMLSATYLAIRMGEEGHAEHDEEIKSAKAEAARA